MKYCPDERGDRDTTQIDPRAGILPLCYINWGERRKESGFLEILLNYLPERDTQERAVTRMKQESTECVTHYLWALKKRHVDGISQDSFSSQAIFPEKREG